MGSKIFCWKSFNLVFKNNVILRKPAWRKRSFWKYTMLKYSVNTSNIRHHFWLTLGSYKKCIACCRWLSLVGVGLWYFLFFALIRPWHLCWQLMGTSVCLLVQIEHEEIKVIFSTQLTSYNVRGNSWDWIALTKWLLKSIFSLRDSTLVEKMVIAWRQNCSARCNITFSHKFTAQSWQGKFQTQWLKVSY